MPTLARLTGNNDDVTGGFTDVLLTGGAAAVAAVDVGYGQLLWRLLSFNQGNVAEVEAATGKLHYDFYYIKHFSPWLDVLITAKTIRTILTGFGSK